MNPRFRKYVSAMVLFFFTSANLHAAVADLANSPLVTSPTSSVPPNLMFILDDSGSMDWNYLPDWANSSDAALFYNNGYNGVAYSAGVTYKPPAFYNADGSLDTTTYPSMTGASTQGSCKADWCAVKDDGYGVQSTSTSNLVSGTSYFYTFIPGEYCDKPNLRTCATQSAASASYPYAAPLRWCTTSGLSTCQASRIDTTYTNARYAGKVITAGKSAATSFTVVGTVSTSVSSITVNGLEILSAATTASTTTSTVATNIRAAINACTSAVSGNCQITGYSASGSGSTVTLTAPSSLGAITDTPVLTQSGTMTMTPVAFSGGTNPTRVPGENVLTNIAPTKTSYPYPGSTTKASTRTDCAGTTCTYAEEMTNYANWWAYYRTRMQMMKTSASIAFQTIDTKYRVGYMSINNNTTTDFLNLGVFDATQKRAWYQKFLAANPGNYTPLREALSKAGRLYAGKYNGSTLNGVTVTDPMQYSCQQNFTILSTDGYWNSTDGFKLDGSTAVGNQDGVEPRPYNDGANLVVTVVTPSVTTVRKQTGQNVSKATPWTRTATTVSATADCSSGSGSATSTCFVDDGHNSSGGSTRTWCMERNTNNGMDCTSAFGTGSPRAYACRGWGTTSAKPGGVDLGCVTDGGGQQWCLYVGNATTGTTSCSRVYTNNSLYVCKPPPPVANGYTVTVQAQTQTETQTGSTTSVDDFATTTNTTVVTTNGVPAPATTSDGGTVTTNVTPLATTLNPSTFSAWANSGSPTSTCMLTPPDAGTSSATSGSTTTTNVGSPSVTTISSVGPVVGTATTSSSSTGGTSDTLADVAEYYYVNDLRTSALGNCTGATGLDVCTNDVPIGTLDQNQQQHMATFTLGLGATGYMQFTPNYMSATSGDFFDVKNGTVANPTGGICGWQSSGACNWPVPASDSQKNIDDLWHAAVNGRGTYFSARDPASLNAGLGSALSAVDARTGSSAAATTSNPNVTSGDNFVFSSTFTTQEWDGQLVRQQLDLITGAVSSTIDWSAQSQLDSNTSRTLHTFSSTGTNKLKPFAWANLTSTEQDYFLTPNINGLSQFCASGVTCLSSASQTDAAGEKLVNFLRGDRSFEGISTDLTRYYRSRVHLLGDIVSAEAVYVKTPLFNYSDIDNTTTPPTTYSAYVSAQASRLGTVYAAANDGMLHAFNSSTGAERWAYVPTMVMPNLYRLADKNYNNLHRYFVDGTPVSGDIYFGSAWHTIVVGGLNGGGRGYYALDVTDPATPKALWEFTDTNMGYTYGNPIITKLADGTWVVLATSGYNNVTPGDGVGRLYVINAGTGALIRSISTGVGNTTTPSGLARINAWVDNSMSDNTAKRAYGGDLLGNLWRFDINNTIGAAGYDAQRLITLYADSAGTVTQPITVKPELGEVSGKAVVYVGTGRFLGLTDLNDHTQQTFYAVKDDLGTTAIGNPKVSASLLVPQVLTTTTCPSGSPATICTSGQTVRVTSTMSGSPPTAVPVTNFATQNGWYVDLPDTGERATTDPTLALGTLGFTTNIPISSACTAGGTSFRYLLDYRTGQMVSTSTTRVSAVSLGGALATRAVFVRLPNNTVVQLTRLSDGTTVTTNVPIGAGAGVTRRVSWRELIQDQ